MPLCGDPIYLTSVPFGQKRPSLPLGREIAKVSVWRANDLAVLRDIVFPIGRTTDLDNVRTLVSHFEHPPLDLADRPLPAIRQQVVNAPLPYLDGISMLTGQGDPTKWTKARTGSGLGNCLTPHPNRFDGDGYVIVGASAA